MEGDKIQEGKFVVSLASEVKKSLKEYLEYQGYLSQALNNIKGALEAFYTSLRGSQLKTPKIIKQRLKRL